MDEQSSSGVSSWLENNPTLALGGAIILVLIVGGYLLSHKAGAAKNVAATTPADLSGLQTNAQGNPLVYVPTQTVFSTYNATDASQSVTNSGSGNVTTGPSTAGNTTSTSTSASSPGPIKKPPVSGPPKVYMQWNETYITHGQSLDLVAKNASISMNNDAIKYNAHGSFVVTGQQIYNANQATVNAFWAAHKIKGNFTGTNVTGLSITIPHLVKE